ncbi:MAG: iron complex outermembrane receptor protein [Saprospiraceae bacterium]|jgi:iron complex outermembrane receptor protein
MNRFILSLFGLFLSISIFAQVTLTGTITDESSETLVGATIFVKENQKVAITNTEGFFKIENLSASIYNIKVSFVGYQDIWKKIDLTNNRKSVNLDLRMTEKIINLNNVTVAATRAGSKSPFTYSTVDEEAIDKQNLGQDVPFILRWTPSTVVSSDAGAGIGYTYMRIRGTDGSRTNVTINGIPLNDAESQGVFWVNLPDFLSSTNDVQIQRGVGTSTNGVGSFGAAINLNTTQMKTEAYGELQASGGSYNTVRGVAKFGTGLINNKFTFDGRISKITSDGYIDRAESNLESIFLSGAYLGGKSSLRLTVFSGHETTYQAWNGVPFENRNDRELRRVNVSGTDKTGTPYDNEVDDYGQTHVQLHYNKMFNPNWNMSLGAHYTKGQGYFEQYKADEDLADYNLGPVMDSGSAVIFTDTDLVRRRWLDNDYYGLTWALNYIQNDNRLQFTFGGAASRYDGDHFGQVIWAERMPANTDPKHQYYFGTGEKLDINVFAKTSYQLTNNLTGYLDLQARIVDYKITGTDNDLRDVTTDDNLFFFNPKAGVFYDFDRTTNLYASFGRTSREPARGDYTDTDPVNGKKPVAETLNNLELGFKKNFQKAVLGVNFYYMGYEDQLIPTGVLNDVGSPIRINVPKSYRAGIELVGGVNLTEKLRFDGTATFSQNKIESFTEFADAYDENGDYYQLETEFKDSDIAYSPNVIVSGSLSYDFIKNDQQNGSVTLLNKYVGEQFLDNTSNDNAKLDAYFISDFRVNYSFKTKFIKEINLTFLVQNLFDELYENNGWVYRFYEAGENPETNIKGTYPQATRNFLVGVGFKF